MKVSDAVNCKVCKKIFCCAKCRHKHEIKTHAIIVQKPAGASDSDGDDNKTKIYVFCPICEEKPLALYDQIYSEVLEHIASNHLPLRCQKCAKVYTEISDLKEFSKCLNPSVSCNEECSTTESSSATDSSKVTVTKANANAQTTISTQTSPIRTESLNDTPMSIINIRWKAKSQITHEEFISDSVSSIRNISSISNCSVRRSIGVAPSSKGKLVRSTSTPVHTEMLFAKPKEQTFNASGGQVSSIYNSGCESYSSPIVLNPSGTPPKQPMDNMNRYLKVGGRTKMIAVTPLRQVMSKSIQKAFAEHGGLPSGSRTRPAIYNRKKMFDSVDTSSSSMGAVGSPPLDLRLSPAVRRTKSEISYSSCSELGAASSSVKDQNSESHRALLLSSQKMTTESIVITRTQHLAASIESTSNSNNSSASSIKPNAPNQSSSLSMTSNGSASSSVYKTCRSVEIITSTELSAVNIHEQSCGYNLVPPITPITRIPGAVLNKKLIKFETPKPETKMDTAGDKFFTPNSTPVRGSPRDSEKMRKKTMPRNLNGRRPSLRDCTIFGRIEDIADDNEEDEVFLPEKQPTKEIKATKSFAQGTGRSWSLSSLMSSVMRLPSLKGGSSCKTEDSADAKSNSIIRRCASIAGSLVRTKPLVDEEQMYSLKRKRTYTTDSQYLNCHPDGASTSPDADCSLASSKRIRIQGRKPIERMRMNS